MWWKCGHVAGRFSNERIPPSPLCASRDSFQVKSLQTFWSHCVFTTRLRADKMATGCKTHLRRQSRPKHQKIAHHVQRHVHWSRYFLKTSKAKRVNMLSGRRVWTAAGLSGGLSATTRCCRRFEISSEGPCVLRSATAASSALSEPEI